MSSGNRRRASPYGASSNSYGASAYGRTSSFGRDALGGGSTLPTASSRRRQRVRASYSSGGGEEDDSYSPAASAHGYGAGAAGGRSSYRATPSSSAARSGPTSSAPRRPSVLDDYDYDEPAAADNNSTYAYNYGNSRSTRQGYSSSSSSRNGGGGYGAYGDDRGYSYDEGDDFEGSVEGNVNARSGTNGSGASPLVAQLLLQPLVNLLSFVTGVDLLTPSNSRRRRDQEDDDDDELEDVLNDDDEDIFRQDEDELDEAFDSDDDDDDSDDGYGVNSTRRARRSNKWFSPPKLRKSTKAYISRIGKLLLWITLLLSVVVVLIDEFSPGGLTGVWSVLGGVLTGDDLAGGEGKAKDGGSDLRRPNFVQDHPYVTSSYYTATESVRTLRDTERIQVKGSDKKKERTLQAKLYRSAGNGNTASETRLAVVRPFCFYDAEALPTTFACWNAMTPCKAAADDLGEDEDSFEFDVVHGGNVTSYDETGKEYFDRVGSDELKTASADVFLFYSQTYSESDVAIKAVDAIIDQFNEPGGWSKCFDNIYAIEANIPPELDLYIPSAQEELYNWVNGPNRQFEAAFRIIQSGEWGEYDGFYLMEGDSVPIKSHWLDVILSEIEVNRPFAILGAQYDGDKWDNFYEQIPISLLHHTNGNAIYNTSHPLMERLVGQLEVEAPCPYNSIPYDYRMSQMWVEGTMGIVPELAPKIMLNEEGENITLSNNTAMFSKWAETWEGEDPFKYTPAIHNYAATNLIPRHLGPEYIIHGAKLYSPWDPTRTDITLVVSEWYSDRSEHLLSTLDDKDHPFSEVILMLPPSIGARDDYDDMTVVPVAAQHREAPDFMDICEADVKTEWFMITNSYHHVSKHVDLMFTPGTFKPVVAFTPATYPFCFKFPYCKETVNLAQRFSKGFDKVVQDMDMVFHTATRNAFCKEWKEKNGDEGELLYQHQKNRLLLRKKIIGPSGPTGTAYTAYLKREGMDDMYKFTDRSLYGARDAFVKVFAKEEMLDGLTEEEKEKRAGMPGFYNSTDCNCKSFETQSDCEDSGLGCIWRPLFDSCHPPELIDGDAPICPQTEAPTMSPTVTFDGRLDETAPPTLSPSKPPVEPDPWYASLFKVREHDEAQVESARKAKEMDDDDDDDSVSSEVVEGEEMVDGLKLSDIEGDVDSSNAAEEEGADDSGSSGEKKRKLGAVGNDEYDYGYSDSYEEELFSAPSRSGSGQDVTEASRSPAKAPSRFILEQYRDYRQTEQQRADFYDHEEIFDLNDDMVMET